MGALERRPDVKVTLVDAGARATATLGRKLGGGAIGDIFDVAGHPALVAKIYVDFNSRRVDHALAALQRPRIEAMLQKTPKIGSPVRDPQGNAFPQLAWPTHQILDTGGRFIGYAMPKLPLHLASDLEAVLLPRSRASSGLPQDWIFRLYVARNLAALLRELHREGHHVVDMKPKNMSIYKNPQNPGLLALLDADGFSISAPGGARFAGTHYTPEYISPELQGRPPELGDELHDRWALAVIIFRLLNENIHPYQGRYQGQDSPTIDDHVRANRYAYGLTPNRQLAPMPASMHEYFDQDTRELFDRAFGASPAARPSARDWRNHLDLFVLPGQTRLLRCSNDPEHWHFAGECGLCFRADLLLGGQRTRKRTSRRAAAPTLTRSPPAPQRRTAAPPPPPAPAPSPPAYIYQPPAPPPAAPPSPHSRPQSAAPAAPPPALARRFWARPKIRYLLVAAVVGTFAFSKYRQHESADRTEPAVQAMAPSASAVVKAPSVGPALTPTPVFGGTVTDNFGVLSADNLAYLRGRLDRLADSGIQARLVVIETTGPESLQDFGVRVGNTWNAAGGDSRSDLLISVASKDRTIRIELTRALNERLTDPEAKGLIDRHFQPVAAKGGLQKGLRALVDQLERVLWTKAHAASEDLQVQKASFDAMGSMLGLMSMWEGPPQSLSPAAQAVMDSAVARLESMPRPARGDRKSARQLHAQGLAMVGQAGFEALAINKLKLAHQADPLDAQVLNDLAFAEMTAEQYGAAMVNLRRTLTLAPTRTSAWVNVAEALPFVSNVGEGAQGLAASSYVLGYYFSKDRAKATEYLRKKVDAADTKAEVRSVARDALQKIEGFARADVASADARPAAPAPALRATTTAETVSRASADDAQGQIAQAEAALRRQDFVDARRLAQAALAVDGSNERARALLKRVEDSELDALRKSTVIR